MTRTGPQLPVLMVAGGPVAPPAPRLLATLAPPDGAGGFGTLVSAFGWRFCRLALSSQNGGCRYRLGAAAAATQLLGSGALYPARS